MELDFIRFILAFICGFFLTVSGSLSQLVTNNGLASPSTLGFDGAAVLAIIISQILINFFGVEFSLTYLSITLISVFVLVWILFDHSLMRFKPVTVWSEHSMKSIVLTGLAFNLFVGALFSIIQFLYMAMNFEFPTSIWFGSLKQYSDNDLYTFIFLFIFLYLFLIKVSKKLELLNIGTSFSLGLNVNVRQFQKTCLIVSFTLTGIVISYYGVFSFLGLVFPHILRHFSIWKNNIRGELLTGPFLTGFSFAAVDYFCSEFDFHGAEFPVGMISSVVGAALLIIMVMRSSKNNG